MSKNKQILIFSGVGLAVLGGVAALLMLTAPANTQKELTVEEKLLGITEATTTGNGEPDETESVSLALSQREENDVQFVEVTAAGETYTITDSGKTGDDGSVIWTIADIEKAPLLTDSLKAAVSGAASFQAKEFAEEVTDSSMLAKYGLDDPKGTVKTTFKDGTVFTFKIGNDVPNSTTTVYITTDDKKVYTAAKSAAGVFPASKFGFVDLKAFHDYDNSSGEEVLRMTIERADLEEPLIIESVSPGNEDDILVYSYRLASPYTAYADLTDSPTFMYSIFGLSAAACEWVGLDERDYEIAGLNEPNCVITVETDVKTYTLTIGKAIAVTETDENGNEKQKITGFYGMSSEVPDVLYRFDNGSISAMTIDPEKLISKLFLMPYIYSLDSIKYSDKDGRSLDVKIETIKAETEGAEDIRNFYVNGEKVTDSQPVKNLYQYFITASGEELYFDEDKGELLAEITYTYRRPTDGIDGKDIIRFYASNADRKVIINLNGQNIFKTRQIYVTQLFKNMDSFFSGGEIVLTY